MIERKDTLPASPEPRVLIVFGRMSGSSIDQAAWFGPADAAAGRAAAGRASLRCLDVTAEEHRKAALGLPKGIINAQGRFSLSPATPDMIALLAALAGPIAPPAAASAPAAALTPESGPGGTPPKPPAPATAPEAAGRGVPGAQPPDVSAALWENLKVGAYVIAPSFDDDGEFAGWWDARIVKIAGNQLTLEWFGAAPKEPRIEAERKYVALIHPAYAKEFD